MKKFITTILTLSIIILSGCASSEPLTEEQQAAEYGLSVEEFPRREEGCFTYEHELRRAYEDA